MRISRHQMFMEIAETVAKRSTCSRLNVGAVIVKDRRVISIGYNGVGPGEPHCSGNDCPGRSYCTLTTHAEVNAHNFIPGWAQGPFDMYVTNSPCESCVNLIKEIGSHRITRVFFRMPYRITKHLFADTDREYFCVNPSGYVMNWRTGQLVDAEI